MTRSKTTKALLGGTAAIATAVGLAALPSTASAQTYGYSGGYYDPCTRDTTQRATTGGLVGAAIGAAVGNQVAARGVRTEGSVLGGLVGAAIGTAVGQRSAACAPGAYPQSYPQSSYGTPYQSSGYGSPGYGYTPQPYGDGRDYGYSPSYGYSTPYGYGQAQGYGYPVSQRSDADGCTLAESPIYLPDGRTQKRFVRVCRDSSGHYQVVD